MTPELVAALGPSAGIIIIVVTFLKHIKHENELITNALDRNTQAIVNNTIAMTKISERLKNNEIIK